MDLRLGVAERFSEIYLTTFWRLTKSSETAESFFSLLDARHKRFEYIPDPPAHLESAVTKERIDDHRMVYQIEFVDYPVDHRPAANQFHLGFVKFTCLDFRRQHLFELCHLRCLLVHLYNGRSFIDFGRGQGEN